MKTGIRDSVFWLVLGLSLVAGDCAAAPGLVGIVNNSKRCTIWIGKPGQAGARRIDPNQVALDNFKPIEIPDTSTNEEGERKFERNLELTILKKGSDIEYKVQIAQTRVEGNLLLIQARTPDKKREAETLVTNAVNSAYMPGISSSPWQGIIIAFKDEAVADATKESPFSFAISAWATNRASWNNQGQNFLKINKTSDGSILFKDKAGNTKYLNVIQGQQALGGGVVPRPKYAHLVHIYNNTDRALDMKRSLGGGQGDSIIIPPYSAVPYIMEWVPERTNKHTDLLEDAKPGIRLALIRPAKAIDGLKPDESLLAGAAGVTALPSEVDVDGILVKMGLLTTDSASSILGTKSITELMRPAGDDTQWNKSGIVYKIYAQNNEINIISRDVRDADASDVLVYPKTGPTYTDYTHPGYFSLIVSEGTDAANPVTFKLIKLNSLDKPYVP